MCLPGSGTEKPPGLGLGTGGRRDAGWPLLCAQGWLGVGRLGVICMCTRVCAMHELCVCSQCMGGWAVCVCVCVCVSVYKHICRLVGCLLAGPNESPRGLLWPESWADSYLTLSAWDPAGCPQEGPQGMRRQPGRAGGGPSPLYSVATILLPFASSPAQSPHTCTTSAHFPGRKAEA